MENKHLIYSTDAQEILDAIPSWIIRWGVTIVFLIFATLVIGCCIIKYPRILRGTAYIVTINPPNDLVANQTGVIDTILFNDGAYVHKNDIIAIIRSATQWSDLYSIESNVKKFNTSKIETSINEDWIYKEYTIGELQPFFSQFQEACSKYRKYLERDYLTKKQEFLIKQTDINNNLYIKLKEKQLLMKKELEIEKNNHLRDSILLSQEVISLSDYEKTKKIYISKCSELVAFEADMLSVSSQIIETRQEIFELFNMHEVECEESKNIIINTLQQLVSQIDIWYEKYVFKSHIDGHLTLSNVWAKNQNIREGQKIASIIPDNEYVIIGKIHIPSNGIGKLKVGQTVNLKLNSFPYMEYGMLKAVITNISEVPEQIQDNSSNDLIYTADIALTNGLVTTYNKQLTLIQQTDAIAEIITEDMRLIEHIIHPIVSLIKNN